MKKLHLPIFLYLGIFISLFAFRLIQPIFAEEAADNIFSVDNETTYKVDDQGKTSVIQKLVFTNNSDDYYVPDYKLTLGSGSISDIYAQEQNGQSISFTVTEENGNAQIDFDFGNKAIDPHASFSWELGYKNNEVTSKNGMIYEVNVPQIANLNEFSDYQINLEVARSLGQKNYISPLPATEREDALNYVFSFGKIELNRNSITAAFGPYQIFDFSLKYQLENTEDYKVYTEIALPADKSNQQVFFELIEPKPENIRIDQDGNFLAYYTLDPLQKLNIQVSGFARTWLISYNLEESEDIYDVPDDVKIYTQPLPFWESDSQTIKQIAKELTQGKESVAEKAKAIFEYVASNLTYNDSRLNDAPERFGALKTLENKDQAVCMEYTDLYIALARAADIPAREIDGYAYNEDENIGYVDVLHAWVEIYVPPFGWMQIDPTWGSTASSLDYFTKLDTNHLAFVTKGLSSETPYPPGSYTESNKKGNILVSFSDQERETKENVSFTFSGVKNIWGETSETNQLSGIFGRTIEVTVTNNSPFTLYRFDTYFDSQELEVLTKEKDIQRFNIPPFGSYQFTLRIKNPYLYSFKEGSLSVTLEGRDHQSQLFTFEGSQTFKFTPVFWDFYPLIIGVIVGIAIVATTYLVVHTQDSKTRKKKKR